MEPAHNIESLPNEVLRDRLRSLANVERRSLSWLLRHLAEANRRHAAQEWGYPSLFYYCTEELNYSEAAAYKRITAARKAADCPMIYELIERGELHLEGVLILAPHLTPENQRDLLERARGMKKAGLEVLLSGHAPRPDRRDFVMRLPEHIQGATTQPPGTLPSDPAQAASSTAAEKALMDDSITAVTRDNRHEHADRLSPGRVHLGMTISEDLWARFQQVRRLLRHKSPKGRLEEVLETMTEFFLNGKDPERRARRRMAKSGSFVETTSSYGAVRDSIFLRDGGRCTFKSSDGRRCPSREWLEIDHWIPRAKGGSDAPENLRLLCRAHNQHAAREVFGSENVGSHRRRARAEQAA